MEENTKLLQEYNDDPTKGSINNSGKVELDSFESLDFDLPGSGKVPFFDQPVGELFNQAGGVQNIDKKLSYYDLEDIPEARAQIQSVGDRLVKILPRIGTKIIEETAKLPGEIYGMGEWLAKGADFKEFGETLNNEWVKGVTSIADATREDILPIYTPRAVQNGNLWDNITSASFWANEGADGVGFLAAMLLPGQFIKALKLGQGIAKLGRSAKLLAEGDPYIANLGRTINSYAATVVNTGFEAISEGMDAAKTLEQTLYNDKLKELTATGLYDPQQAADLAKEYIQSPEVKKKTGEAGFHTFAANIPILLASNALDQKWLFNGFNRSKALTGTGEMLDRRLGKAVGKAGGEFLSDVAPLTAKEKNLRLLEGLGAGIAKEGFFEEGLQYSSSKYYEDKARLGKNSSFLEDITNNLETYFDSLGEVEMQKSIFLGAAMGGVMGGIGSRNEAKLEDRMLFGDQGKTMSKTQKFFGLQDRQERKGLVNLLKENLNSHYQTFNDLLLRDKDGNVAYTTDENGETRIAFDPVALQRAGQNKIQEDINKTLLNFHAQTGNKEAFDAVKNEFDMSYMLPYLREEGGYELLVNHINRMAEEDTKLLQEMGVDTKSSQEVKEDLLTKAKEFKKIYDGVNKTLRSRYVGEEGKYAKMFNATLFDSAFKGEALKSFLNRKHSEYSSDLNKLLTGEHINNLLPVESVNQFKKGQLLNIEGVKAIVVSRKGDTVRYRKPTGEVEEINGKELLDKKPQVYFSIPVADRQQIFNKSELVENVKADLVKTSRDVEQIYSKEGQKELFDDFMSVVKDDEKRVKQETEKKAEEELRKAKTPEEVAKVSEDLGKKATEKAERSMADKEMMDNFTALSELTDQLNPQTKKDKQEGELSRVRTLYKNNPIALKKAVEELSTSLASLIKTPEAAKALDEYLKNPNDGYENFIQFVEDAEATGRPLPMDMVVDYNEAEGTDVNELLSKHILDYYEQKRARVKAAIQAGFVVEPTVDQSNIPSQQELDDQDSMTIEHVFGGNIVAVDSSGEYVILHDVEFDFNESKKERGHKHRVVYNEDGSPKKRPIDNQLIKQIEEGLKAIADGKLQDANGNVRKDIVVSFRVDKGSEYNQGKRKYPNSEEFIKINEDNLQIQVFAEVDGKDIFIGLLPNSKGPVQHKNQQLKDLRTKIYNETSGKTGMQTTSFTTNLEEVLPGKIQRTSQKADQMHSPSKVAGKKPYYLTVVTSIGEVLVHNDGSGQMSNPNIPKGVINVTDASGLQNGAIYMWIEHPVLKGRWFPIRTFTKKLGEMPELKQQVIDLLRTIDSSDKYSEVNNKIRDEYAWIAFTYDKEGYIIPKENGIEKPEMKMLPSEVGTKFNSWLDSAGVQVNKRNLNVTDIDGNNSNKSSLVDDRLRVNVKPGEPFFLMNARISLDNIAEVRPTTKPKKETIIKTQETIVKEPEVTEEEQEEQSKTEEHGKETETKQASEPKEKVLTEQEKAVDQAPQFTSPDLLDSIDLDSVEFGEDLTTDEPSPNHPERAEDYRKLSTEEYVKKWGYDDNHPPFRLASEEEYTPWNKEEELAWFEKNFPGVPIQALDNLRSATMYGRKLWGLFKNASVYIATDAAKGTVYHEAFHVVFNMYLTEKQRTDLLKGTTEEILADEFMDYTITDMENKSLGNKINSFFRYLWAVIKRIATGKTFVDEIFYRANHGMYKNSPLTKSIEELKSDDTERPRVPGWTARRERQAAAIINNYIINRIIPRLKNLRNAEGNLVNPKYQSYSDAEIIKAEGIGKIYKEIVGTLLKSYLSQKDPVYKKKIKETLDALADYSVAGSEFIFKGYSYLYDSVVKDLVNYGIKVEGSRANPNSQKISEETFDVNSEEEVNLDGAEEQDDLGVKEDEIGHTEAWYSSNQEKSTKIKINSLVKKYIRNLSQIKVVNGIPTVVRDETGLFTIPVKFDEFYDTLMKDVSDSLTLQEMVDTLEDLKVFRPEYETIINSIKSDHEFATAFFSTFNKPLQLQVFASEGREGDFIVSEANRKTIKKVIIEDWASGVIESGVVDDNGFIDAARVERILDVVTRITPVATRATKEDFIYLAKELQDFGLFISPEVFLYLQKNKGLDIALINLKIILNAMKGSEKTPAFNPFDPNSPAKENRAIEILANFVKRGDTSLSESSHRNVANKTVYAHLEGNYMIRRITKMARSKEDFEAIKEQMSKDPVTRAFLAGFEWHENLRFAVLDGLRYANQYNGKGYPEMDPVDLNVTILNMFRNNGSSTDAFYRTTTLSDAPVMTLLQYKKQNIKDKTTGKLTTDKLSIVNALSRVAVGEVRRIARLQERQKAFDDGTLDKRYKIANYDNPENATLKAGFKMLPFLNGVIKEMPAFDLNDNAAWTKSAEMRVIKEAIFKYLEKESEDYLKQLVDQEIVSYDKKTNTHSLVKGRLSSSLMKEYKTVKDFIDDFIYNDYFVRTQVVTIGMGDIAFYAKDKKSPSNTVDPQKRSKETVSPKALVDTTAYYEVKDDNGNVIETIHTGDTYTSFYLNDQEFYSSVASNVFNALIKGKETDKKARRKALMIAINYGFHNLSVVDDKGNVTDLATDDQRVVSAEFKDGKIIYKDAEGKVLSDVETFKPKRINQTDGQSYITMDFYRRTMIGMQRWNAKLQNSYDRIMKKKGTVEDVSLITESFTLTKPFMFTQTQQTIGGQTINIPVQHKNSEYILIPQLVEQGDEKIQKVFNMMKDKKVDIMNFSSAVKVGGFASEDIETVTDPIIHTFSMTDRGMQQEVPEHYLDTQSNFGTQIRKHIMAGLAKEGIYKLPGGDRTGAKLFDLYNDIITENILESYRELERELYDVKKTVNEDGTTTITKTPNIQKIKNILLGEIRSRNKGEEYEKAIELVFRNGKLDFALPLSHPVQGRVVESLLNSIFKNRVTKQKINGGAFVQVSNFGFTDKLKVNINTETGALENMEVMLPWWSREMFERYMDENGDIDIARIEAEEPELLKGIGYRIPTEDKYSMVPLKIVGFLPQEAGGAVMLPAEITTIAGSDFDIDKLYIMLKERVKATDLAVHPNYKEKLEEQYQLYKYKLIDEKNIQNWDEERGRIKFASERNLYWDGSNWFYKKEDPRAKRFKVAEYNYNKPASQNSRAARNNAVIDIMYSVLTNPNTFMDFINPGGYPTLTSLSNQLTELAKKDSRIPDFMTARTQNAFAIANMVGKSLVGVAANHTANYSIRLYTNLRLESSVKFDGNKQTSLHDSVDYRGDSIGKNLAEFLAAIVDNAKDPVASYIFYNGYTADVISLLVSSGVPLETAITFINQPILKEFIESAIKGGLSKQKALLNSFAKSFGLNANTALASDISTEDLWKSLRGELSEEEQKKLNSKVVSSFLQYRRQADDLGTFIRATRGDTTGGAAGPTIADTERKIGFIEKALQMEEIKGVEEVFPTKPINETEIIELAPEKSNIKWVATFIQNGLIEADKFLANFFPYSKPAFDAIKKRIEFYKGSPLTVKEINLLNSHIMSFAMSGHSFYNMSEEERKRLIYEFPTQFANMKKSDPYLREENGMTKRLKLEQTNNGIGKDFVSISYDNTNTFSNNQAEDIKVDFLDLLQSDKPEYRELGMNLIKYAFVTSGFNFGPNSFFQMIPVEFYTEVLPELNGQDLNTYIDKIMEESVKADIFMDGFKEQFYRNMWRRSSFVPLVDVNEKNMPIDFNVSKKQNGTIELTFRKDEQGALINVDSYMVGSKTSGKSMIPFVLAKLTIDKRQRDILLQWNESTNSYVETYKLGVPNYVLEYDRNNVHLKSAIKSNDLVKVAPPSMPKTVSDISKTATTRRVATIQSLTVTPEMETEFESNPSNTTNLSSLIPKKEVKGRIIEVKKDDKSNWSLLVEENGTVTNTNTKKPLDPVKDARLINEAKLKSGYYQYTKVHVDSTNADYAVVHHSTEGTKVISLAKSNMGGEVTLTSKVAQEALAKAPTAVESAREQLKDKQIAEQAKPKNPFMFSEEQLRQGPDFVRSESLTEEEAKKLADNKNPDLNKDAEDRNKYCEGE